MPATVVMGCQWGDEGKGKIVDVLAEDAHVVARYQGGSNAGHTVIVSGKKYVLHTLPSGVLRPELQNVIGNGVVVDVLALATELGALKELGMDVLDGLRISEQAHVILPFHREVDAAQEGGGGEGGTRLGTTRRGIGVAYADKARRVGLRMGDLREADRFARKYRELATMHSAAFRARFGAQLEGTEEGLEAILALRSQLVPVICDTVTFVNQALKARRHVLCEGAQGIMLDIDHGTYPFVTSSSPGPGGACTGLGIPPSSIRRVVGIAKAYTTRVGEGPFPTELHSEAGERLRSIGNEFGATTGRPRRCGWLDLPVLRRAVQIAGCTELIITKLDVLGKFAEIPICSEYQAADGRRAALIPLDGEELAGCHPVYELEAGWSSDISGVRDVDELPRAAWSYLERIAQETGVRVTMVSTGPEREATILLAETCF
ncbi:adenylosuccinate synthase [Candidatus Poribacteria bacterium]|nr:adenylosuccinate synthase [Candidatus Poribacteria bacterium]